MNLHHKHGFVFYVLIVLVLIAGLFYANPVRSSAVENIMQGAVEHVPATCWKIQGPYIRGFRI